MAIQLYDTHRDVRYDKPSLRGWLHLASFAAVLVLGPLLVHAADGTRARLVTVAYVGCVAGLFGISALYHRGRWGPAAARRLQRLDHTMIILMIAGSATPAFALSVSRGLRPASLIALWSLAGAAITARLVWLQAPERLVGAIYLLLGWIAGAAIPAVWVRNGVAPALLLIAGGVLYTVGAAAYHRRAFDFRPAVFGYHETFHLCVTAAAGCQFVAMVAVVT